MKRYYLYSNSECQSYKRRKGWIMNPKWLPGKKRNPVIKHKNKTITVYTTTEYAFALEFNDRYDAEDWLMKHEITAIIFERVDA